MGTLPNSLLASNLSHIIAQRATTLTGVRPASIQGTDFTCTVDSLEFGREIEVQGVVHSISASILLNASGLVTVPSIGAILEDNTGRVYKVMDVQQDDPANPVAYRMDCIERYQPE